MTKFYEAVIQYNGQGEPKETVIVSVGQKTKDDDFIFFYFETLGELMSYTGDEADADNDFYIHSHTEIQPRQIHTPPNQSWLHGKYKGIGEINTALSYVAIDKNDFFAQGESAELIINEIHHIWLKNTITEEEAFQKYINLYF